MFVECFPHYLALSLMSPEESGKLSKSDRFDLRIMMHLCCTFCPSFFSLSTGANALLCCADACPDMLIVMLTPEVAGCSAHITHHQFGNYMLRVGLISLGLGSWHAP